MASVLARYESSGLLCVGTPKDACVCSSCFQLRGTSPSHFGFLSNYLQLPQHPSVAVVVHDEMYQGVH
jgi:hypothetical protein